MYTLLERVQLITGFELEEQVLEELRNIGLSEIVEVDIKKLPEKTKHVYVFILIGSFSMISNIIAYAEATSLYIQSRRKEGAHKRRLFDLSMKRFESAIATKPDDAITVYK